MQQAWRAKNESRQHLACATHSCSTPLYSGVQRKLLGDTPPRAGAYRRGGRWFFDGAAKSQAGEPVSANGAGAGCKPGVTKCRRLGGLRAARRHRHRPRPTAKGWVKGLTQWAQHKQFVERSNIICICHMFMSFVQHIYLVFTRFRLFSWMRGVARARDLAVYITPPPATRISTAIAPTHCAILGSNAILLF